MDLDLEVGIVVPRKFNDQSKTNICFGMLKNIQVRPSHTRAAVSSEFDQLEEDGEVLLYLDLVFTQGRCEVQSKCGQSIAVMSNKTYQALSSVISLAKSVKYTGLVPRKDLARGTLSNSAATGVSPATPPCFIRIQIFGAAADKHVVGRELTQHRLFLQHPFPFPPSVIYENPHYLNMGNGCNPLPNGAILPPISTPTSFSQSISEDMSEALDPKTTDIISIMDHLPDRNYLEVAHADKRIKTSFYQLEGVSFIMHRENLKAHKPGSLWRHENSNPRDSCYRHSITNTKSSVPHDILGGMLADDMGLGKTLTMISAIASSTSFAEKYEQLGSQKNEDRGKTGKIPAKSSLVVAPSPLIMDGWAQELEKHTVPGGLKYYKYHGSKRCLETSSPPPYDIVLTTYGTLVTDFSRGGGVLSHFQWYRLVLDEAHVIRNSSTQTFKAVMGISASIRWCISGTPIQNSIYDFESLIKFLRIPILDNPTIFRKLIAGTKVSGTYIERPNYQNLRLILESICLRRTTAVLPELGVSYKEHRVDFSEAEKRDYETWKTILSQRVKEAINSAKGAGGSRIILTAILLLRIFCNNGVHSSLTIENFFQRCHPDEATSLNLQNGDTVCVMCNEYISSSLSTDSKMTQKAILDRLLCTKCKSESSSLTHASDQRASENSTHSTTYHDNPATQILNRNTDPDNHDVAESTSPRYQSSYPSKLMALLADIKNHIDDEKSIVFSYWRRSLDLVGNLFDTEAISYCRVDGAVHLEQRKKILQEFQTEDSKRVLLITLGTGSVGLNNLSVASRIHILEPQWNPSIESQAVGRVLRLGQRNNVCVIRYIVKNTIEEGVEDRQHMKVQIAQRGGLHSENDPEYSRRAKKMNRLHELAKSLKIW